MATVTGKTCSPPAAFPRLATRRGFTLTEVLIALGIMGIGMTMASALFPTAIKQDAVTFQDMIGSMIAQNGIAVAKASAKANAGDVVGMPLRVLPQTLDSQYPVGTDPSTATRGSIVLVRLINANSITYQMVSIAYQKLNGGTVATVPVTITGYVASDPNYPGGPATAQLTGGNFATDVVVGSPLIDLSTGQYAMITGLDENANPKKVILSHPFNMNIANPAPNPRTAFALPANAIVVRETGVTYRSPALTVLVTQASLNQ